MRIWEEKETDNRKCKSVRRFGYRPTEITREKKEKDGKGMEEVEKMRKREEKEREREGSKCRTVRLEAHRCSIISCIDQWFGFWTGLAFFNFSRTFFRGSDRLQDLRYNLLKDRASLSTDRRRMLAKVNGKSVVTLSVQFFIQLSREIINTVI